MTQKEKRTKQLCPTRLYADMYEKVKVLAHEDGMTYQKVFEVLMYAYITGERNARLIIEKYQEAHALHKKTPDGFDDLAREDILRIIEQQSPLTKLEKEIKEALKDEE